MRGRSRHRGRAGAGAQARPSWCRARWSARMKPGSVIVDVSVDQGGCVETTRPTTHSDPVYVVDGVLHYCVANMPGIVPRTSTFALTNATLPLSAAARVRRCGAGDSMPIPGWPRGSMSRTDKVTCRGSGRSAWVAFHPCLVRQSILRLSRSICRGVAQPGSALRSGRRGRRFKSSRPDQTKLAVLAPLRVKQAPDKPS